MSILDKILSPSDCAECRYCCSLRRSSLWETPCFDNQTVSRLLRSHPNAKFRPVDQHTQTIDLISRYKTDNPDEEVLCWFNEGKGCILGEDKPLDCDAWPLRLMRKDGQLVIALSPGCKVISAKPLTEVMQVIDDELCRKMLDYAEKFPSYVKNYIEGYRVLKILTGK